jgi:uncharacterized protein (DUF39 family)
MKESQLLEMKNVQPMSMHKMKEYSGGESISIVILTAVFIGGIQGFIIGAGTVSLIRTFF